MVSVVEPTRFQVIRAPACTTEWHDLNSPLIAEPYTHCGYKIEADARERRRMLAARRNLFALELQISADVQSMQSRIRVAENIGHHLLGLPAGGGSSGSTKSGSRNGESVDGEDGDTDAEWTGIPPFSDVTFVVEGQKVYAHRAIVSSRSAYFRRMLLGGLREASEAESGREIAIADTRAPAFRAVIKYMYTGQCGVHHNNALELLHAAHLFCLDGLAKSIESFLFRAVATETAIEIIVAAHTYSLKELEEHCVEFIIDNYEMFATSQEGFAKLASYPHILIGIMERIRKPKKRKSTSRAETGAGQGAGPNRGAGGKSSAADGGGHSTKSDDAAGLGFGSD